MTVTDDPEPDDAKMSVIDGLNHDDGDDGYMTVDSRDQILDHADMESVHVEVRGESPDVPEVTTRAAKAPDGGWGWCVVLGALIMRTVIGGFGRSHGLFYLRFKDRYGGTATETALVTSLTGFVRMASGPFVSVLSGRFSCRLITAIGTVVLMAGVVMTGYSPNLLFLYFSYGLVAGLGRSLAMTPCPILLGYYFDKRRSLAFGIASAGFSIGGFAITPLIELLFQEYGYSGAFLILTAFTMNIFVAAVLFRPLQADSKRGKCSKQTQVDSDEAKQALIQTAIVSNELRQSDDIAVNGSAVNGHVEDVTIALKTCDNNVAISDLAFTNGQSENIGILLEDKSASAKTCSFFPKIITIELATTNEKKSMPHDEVTSQTSKLSVDKTASENAKIFGAETDTTNETSEDETQTRNEEDDNKKKQKWMSWSILKNPRFMCYTFAMFCFSLPASGTFFPALAKSKGCTEIQAATILSISAGCDMVIRVISGFVLDLEFFRNKRPLVFNIVTFFQGSVLFLFPNMTSFSGFALLSVLEGAFTGIKEAQGSVVLLDMLGVDKFASSLAVQMAAQCVSLLVGPTISGRLVDNSGSYEGAFIFGGSSILLGGVVMAIGNIYNKIATKRSNLAGK
ncbi:monocarboxylate transporter 4-like [Dreissena polymorpha]|uniref:Uncharacterized protein n=1 Tax=Dreissena polymorpha TaxID=45954 RepID=A0A9D4FNV7_DREPO|nr:monocarboxylate transporter 4-like [Dreissena polymorpha]XP_052221643.1 monocarboxylate transporter 4-like [Dreissena polymorpha]XP_052221644.1 monocarboxylate transporter 4-like [Dreissena polymorpha]XP_052221645.1 monocarboxylate transporter 4-like [Dreissena polymorpha]XP_052221646.1 monocarboxylate transporter 4-like [Dreissena polymorpha]KAH3799815.1 hypothetical protein DPMN_153431 [Dreissena polymorpha]